MDKNKKELLKNFKEEHRRNFIQSLPMPVEKFTALFDFLDETIDECGDELSLTRLFLMENNLPIDEVIEWLEKMAVTVIVKF